MRGSPLIRTLIVLIALLAAGFGLVTIGSSGSKDSQPKSAPIDEPSVGTPSIDTPFILTLSAPAKKVFIESLGQTYFFEATSQTLSGSIPIELGHPTLFIDIEWTDQNPSPRFAKLALEPVGFPTLTKIFDTTGDLSDVWEIHLHHDDHE
jgi:hypothetical protein